MQGVRRNSFRLTPFECASLYPVACLILIICGIAFTADISCEYIVVCRSSVRFVLFFLFFVFLVFFLFCFVVVVVSRSGNNLVNWLRQTDGFMQRISNIQFAWLIRHERNACYFSLFIVSLSVICGR